MKANIYGRDFKFGRRTKARRENARKAAAVVSFPDHAGLPNVIDEEVEDIEVAVVDEMRRVKK